jgi:hypothetical protein
MIRNSFNSEIFSKDLRQELPSQKYKLLAQEQIPCKHDKPAEVIHWFVAVHVLFIDFCAAEDIIIVIKYNKFCFLAFTTCVWIPIVLGCACTYVIYTRQTSIKIALRSWSASCIIWKNWWAICWIEVKVCLKNF